MNFSYKHDGLYYNSWAQCSWWVTRSQFFNKPRWRFDSSLTPPFHRTADWFTFGLFHLEMSLHFTWGASTLLSCESHMSPLQSSRLLDCCSVTPPLLSTTFLKEVFLVIDCCPSDAVSIDPFLSVILYGLTLNGVLSLEDLGCLTNTAEVAVSLQDSDAVLVKQPGHAGSSKLSTPFKVKPYRCRLLIFWSPGSKAPYITTGYLILTY